MLTTIIAIVLIGFIIRIIINVVYGETVKIEPEQKETIPFEKRYEVLIDELNNSLLNGEGTFTNYGIGKYLLSRRKELIVNWQDVYFGATPKRVLLISNVFFFSGEGILSIKYMLEATGKGQKSVDYNFNENPKQPSIEKQKAMARTYIAYLEREADRFKS